MKEFSWLVSTYWDAKFLLANTKKTESTGVVALGQNLPTRPKRELKRSTYKFNCFNLKAIQFL